MKTKLKSVLIAPLALALTASCSDPATQQGGVQEAPIDDGIEQDDDIQQDAASAAGSALGIELEPRDGWGPFYIRTTPSLDVPNTTYQDFPSSEWECTAKEVHVDDTGTTAILWRGCRIDHLDRLESPDLYAGDFDVAAIFAPNGTAGVDLSMWVDNRLNVGIDRFRYVMRVDPASLGDSQDARALFGYDDYIEDPVNSLREQVNDPTWMIQVASVEGNTDRYFVRNRIKITSMMSLHTPSWGLLLHGTDPDNADPGWLILGSNPDDDGVLSLELGYDYKLQNPYEAGNGTSGPMQMGSTLRSVPLAAERPIETAWWEAVDAYVPFLESETDLLPNFEIGQAAYPATWAQDCLFAAWNVGAPVITSDPDDLSHFIDELHSVAERYASDSAEPIVFCPLLWGMHTYAPHQPRPEVLALLDEMMALAPDLNIELHAGAYFLPWAGDRQRLIGHPVEAAIDRRADGSEADLGDGTVLLRQDHPALVDDVLNVLRDNYEHGVHWAYHDNPFREGQSWVPLENPTRDRHVATRNLIASMADTLTELGGGLVAIEQGRLGLNALQTGAAGLTVQLIPGSHPTSVPDALFHGRHLTGFAGDIVGESLNIAFADERALALWCPNTNSCPYVNAQTDNADHMARLAMTAALGRSVIDPMPNLSHLINDPATPAWSAAALTNYQTAVRNAYWLRRSNPILRTGRMRPTPASDGGVVSFRSRLQVGANPFNRQHDTIVRTVDRYTTGFFQDVQNPNHHTLVVGNSEPSTSGRITFTLTRADYGNLVDAQVDDSFVVARDADTLVIAVDVAPLEFALVELTQ